MPSIIVYFSKKESFLLWLKPCITFILITFELENKAKSPAKLKASLLPNAEVFWTLQRSIDNYTLSRNRDLSSTSKTYLFHRNQTIHIIKGGIKGFWLTPLCFPSPFKLAQRDKGQKKKKKCTTNLSCLITHILPFFISLA